MMLCRPFASALLALAAACAVGCAEFASGDDLLMTGELGGELNPAAVQDDPWWCLDSSESVGVDQADNATQSSVVTLRLPVHDQVTQQPPADLEARVCRISDVECSAPAVDWAPVPADGAIVKLVDWGFEGFVQLRGEAYPPTLFAVDTPVVRDLSLYSHSLLPSVALQALGRAIMRDIVNEEQGLLLVSATDCNGAYASGVQVTIDKESYSYSIVNGLPVPGNSDTGSEGTVGFGGVGAGAVSVEGRTLDGRLIDRQAVPIQAGAYTGMYLRPAVYSAEEVCGPDGSRTSPGLARSLVRLRPCSNGAVSGAAE